MRDCLAQLKFQQCYLAVSSRQTRLKKNCFLDSLQHGNGHSPTEYNCNHKRFWCYFHIYLHYSKHTTARLIAMSEYKRSNSARQEEEASAPRKQQVRIWVWGKLVDGKKYGWNPRFYGKQNLVSWCFLQMFSNKQIYWSSGRLLNWSNSFQFPVLVDFCRNVV